MILILFYPIIKEGDERWMKVRKVDPESAQLVEGWVSIFLKDVIWKESETNSMIHGFLEVDWMKQNRNIDHFIGQGYDENDKPLYSGDSSGEKIR